MMLCWHSHSNSSPFQVYGLTGAHSSDHWTPPFCSSTTPVPTTTTTTAPTTKADEGAFDRAVEKNQKLKDKLSGLKQAYGPIGKQVYESLKDGVYKAFEGFLARKQVAIAQTSNNCRMISF